MMSEESTPVPIAAAAAAAKAVAGSSSNSSSADSSADSKTIPNISELLRSMTTKTTIETPTTTTTTISGEDNNTTTTTTTTTTDPILTIAAPQKSPPLVHCRSHVPSSLSLPKTISRSYLIYKIPTHMFCQIYNDRIVLGITQLSKSKKGHIGSWVLCQSSKSEINPKNIDYELSTLLGNNTTTTTSNTAFDEKEIYSRRITERLLEKAIVVPRGIDKLTVLLGISLLPLNSNSNPNNSKTKSSTSEENDDFTSTSFTSMERFKIIVEVLVELIEETASL